jgi:hypothetical protein
MWTLNDLAPGCDTTDVPFLAVTDLATPPASSSRIAGKTHPHGFIVAFLTSRFVLSNPLTSRPQLLFVFSCYIQLRVRVALHNHLNFVLSAFIPLPLYPPLYILPTQYTYFHSHHLAYVQLNPTNDLLVFSFPCNFFSLLSLIIIFHYLFFIPQLSHFRLFCSHKCFFKSTVSHVSACYKT